MTTEKGSALVPVEQREVDFHGDRIVAVLVEVEGQAGPAVYVPVRPLCNYLGLAWPPQFQRIQRDPVLSSVAKGVIVTITPSRGTRGGGPQTAVCLPIEFIHGWLFGVDSSRVKPELRERLNLYRLECFAMLWRAFNAEALALVRHAALEARIDKAAVIVGDIGRRLTTVERLVAPGQPITEAQAADLSQRVKALALLMTEAGPNQVHFQAVWGELYRRFGVTSYRALPVDQYPAAVEFLDAWRAAVLKGTGQS